jgi:hypothetical protein
MLTRVQPRQIAKSDVVPQLALGIINKIGLVESCQGVNRLLFYNIFVKGKTE